MNEWREIEKNGEQAFTVLSARIKTVLVPRRRQPPACTDVAIAASSLSLCSLSISMLSHSSMFNYVRVAMASLGS